MKIDKAAFTAAYTEFDDHYASYGDATKIALRKAISTYLSLTTAAEPGEGEELWRHPDSVREALGHAYKLDKIIGNHSYEVRFSLCHISTVLEAALADYGDECTPASLEDLAANAIGDDEIVRMNAEQITKRNRDLERRARAGVPKSASDPGVSLEDISQLAIGDDEGEA